MDSKEISLLLEVNSQHARHSVSNAALTDALSDIEGVLPIY